MQELAFRRKQACQLFETFTYDYLMNTEDGRAQLVQRRKHLEITTKYVTEFERQHPELVKSFWTKWTENKFPFTFPNITDVTLSCEFNGYLKAFGYQRYVLCQHSKWQGLCSGDLYVPMVPNQPNMYITFHYEGKKFEQGMAVRNTLRAMTGYEVGESQ